MSKPGSSNQPLLIEWSPQRVRIVDVAALRSSYCNTIAECVDGPQSGRDVIVAVSQRSAFIRSLFVPNSSKSEIAKIIALQLDRVLPLGPQEYVFGFRLGHEVPGKGRIAVVGAMKTESLRRIYSEAELTGLRVRAVLPLAFGSWLAAKAHNMAECAVVDARDDILNVDIVQDGELWYSRSIPAPEQADEVNDEVARSFAIAEVSATPILSVANPGVDADSIDAKEAIEYLGDPHAVDRHLFSFELPEITAARHAKAVRWQAQRAIAACVVAIGLGVFAYISHQPEPVKSTDSPATRSALQAALKTKGDTALNLERADRANRILDVAFQPGQTLSDMVTVLANTASEKSWFTNLVVGRGVPITIGGIALGDSEVAKFVEDLSKDGRFEEMKVVTTSKVAVGKKPVTRFVVSGKAVGSLAFDRPPKTEKKK